MKITVNNHIDKVREGFPITQHNMDSGSVFFFSFDYVLDSQYQKTVAVFWIKKVRSQSIIALKSRIK